MRVALSRFGVAIAMVALGTSTVSAQFIGAFSWQLQPYCNVITLNVTQQGSTFALEGWDDRCGAATRAPAVGVAVVNPDGTIGLGLTLVTPLEGDAWHLDATVFLPSASGRWRGPYYLEGTFAFGASTGGDPLPRFGGSVTSTAYSGTATFAGFRSGGTIGAPAAVGTTQIVASLNAMGHTGSEFEPGGRIWFRATQNWTPTARGMQIQFATTNNDATSNSVKMTIDHDGDVGIGTDNPLSRLHVNGAARIGSCVYEEDGDVACVSDRRFKRDVRAFPEMLDRVASLQPVRYSWRREAFPERQFTAGESVGLIAQDVEQVMPELVVEDTDGAKAVSYSRLPLYAIQAIKELKAENDRLKAQNAAVEQRIAAIEAAMLRKP